MRQLSQKSEKTYIYQSITTLSAWIKWVIVGYVIIASFTIFYSSQILLMLNNMRHIVQSALQSTLDSKQLIKQIDSVYSEVEQIALIAKLSMSLGSLIFIISVVCICIWIHRSHQNARVLGLTEIKSSPAWAVGSFFVPIAMLFSPYQAMKQLVYSSLNAVKQTIPSWLLLIWWITWLSDMLLTFIVMPSIQMLSAMMWANLPERLAGVNRGHIGIHFYRNIGDNMIFAMGAEVLNNLISIISAILLLRIIQMVNRAHQQLYEMKDDLNHESQSN